MSHSNSKSSWFVIGIVFGMFFRDPVSCLCINAFSILIPSGLYIAPDESDNAMIFDLSCFINFAKLFPAFPNP